MEYVTNDTVEQIVKANGQETAVRQYVDNRMKIEVDSKQVETWEIMAMEEGNITKAMMIFARYLCRGDKPISPGLPSDPVDELNKADTAMIKNSDAYKLLKRFKLPELKAAIEAFVEGASAGF